MTKESAMNFVFDCNRGQLEYLAQQYGFKGSVTKANRCKLEEFLIKSLTS